MVGFYLFGCCRVFNRVVLNCFGFCICGEWLRLLNVISVVLGIVVVVVLFSVG